MTLDDLKHIIREEGGDPGAQGGHYLNGSCWYWPDWKRASTEAPLYFIFEVPHGILRVREASRHGYIAVENEAEAREWVVKMLREMVLYTLRGDKP